MSFDPVTLAVVLAAVFLIGLTKGAFGGGFAIIGIPLLGTVMDPLTGGAVLAPLFVIMDMFALRYWKPGTWSLSHLRLLVPGQIVGIAIGTLVLHMVNAALVKLLIALLILIFSAQWLIGAAVALRGARPVLGVIAGTGSGFTTMIAHAGGPPLTMYLLSAGLSKEVYAGTASIFFTLGNLMKAVPWLAVAPRPEGFWALVLICIPAALAGVWAGWLLHHRLDRKRLFGFCHVLLIATGLKLLWDALTILWA